MLGEERYCSVIVMISPKNIIRQSMESVSNSTIDVLILNLYMQSRPFEMLCVNRRDFSYVI